VRVTARPAVDQTRCLFTVELDDVSVGGDHLLCEPGPRALEILERVLAVAAVAAACDATGATERVLEVTSEYASQRMQFGKPIGSFQAVKHHCANMAVSVETSRAAVRAILDVLDGDPAAWSERAAVAASYVGPACSAACGLGLRVHGGIGFTWEHDIHLFLKRVKLDEVLFGTPAWHRQRLAGSVFPRLIAARAGNDEARTA
jgi:alkylation response protein AidB-like acyl-CoA dehydrogenase